MRVVRGDHDVVVADRLHHLAQRLLVGVGRDVALAEEVLARRLRDLDLRARPELLPRLVEPPEIPRQPAARALEERAAQPRVPLQHAAGGHAAEGHHQLDRVAPRHADDPAVRRVDVAARDVVTQRRLPRRVEAHGHAQLLDRVPQRLELGAMDMASVDRVRVADHGDGAQLAHGAPGLGNRARDVVEGQLGGELEPRRVDRAEIARPVVVRTRQGGRHLRVVVHQHLAPARAVDDGDVDALNVHRLQMRRRVVAARVRHRVVRMAGEGAILQALAHHRRARALRHLGDLEVADRDERLVHRPVGAPREPWRELLERLVQVLLPEAVRLHRVQIAVQNPESIFHGRELSPVHGAGQGRLSTLSPPRGRGQGEGAL